MSDKVVIIDGNKAFVWFYNSKFCSQGEEFVLLSKDEDILNESQQRNKYQFQYTPDIQLSIKERDPVHEEMNIMILSKSSAILRGDKNIVTENSITIYPQQKTERVIKSKLIFETRRGIKYVDMKFQEPPTIRPYVILSTLNEEEHRQLTKLVYKDGPVKAMLKILEFKGNHYRNQGDNDKQYRYHNKEIVFELEYINNQLNFKEHRFQFEQRAIAA